MGDQVGDRPEVRIDRELMAAGVVEAGLVLEVTRRSGAVARGDPSDVGEIDSGVEAAIGIGVVFGSGSPSSPPWAGSRLTAVCGDWALGGVLRVWGRVVGRSAGSSPALLAVDSADRCRGGWVGR
jgi:hypothetical protein